MSVDPRVLIDESLLIYEGKAKRVYEMPDSDSIIQEFKDSATAFDGKKAGSILNKGHVNAKLSSILFTILTAYGIENHFRSYLGPNLLITIRLEMIALEVVVRNIAAGSLSKRLGYPEGQALSRPIVEFYYKNDSLGDPLINDMHAFELVLINEAEGSHLIQTALKINDLLKSFFSSCNLDLVDFKLEFGRLGDKILLGDEISPDTCRLWDKDTKEKLDKDRFRRDLGSVEEAYLEVLSRAEQRVKSKESA